METLRRIAVVFCIALLVACGTSDAQTITGGVGIHNHSSNSSGGTTLSPTIINQTNINGNSTFTNFGTSSGTSGTPQASLAFTRPLFGCPGAGNNTMVTQTIKGGLLTTTNSTIRITTQWSSAGTANAKTIFFDINGSTFSGHTVTASSQRAIRCEIVISRSGVSTNDMGTACFEANGVTSTGAVTGEWDFSGVNWDQTTDATFHAIGNCGAANDLTLRWSRIEVVNE